MGQSDIQGRFDMHPKHDTMDKTNNEKSLKEQREHAFKGQLENSVLCTDLGFRDIKLPN